MTRRRKKTYNRPKKTPNKSLATASQIPPESTGEDIRQGVTILSASKQELFTGPLPHPDILEKYNAIIHDGAERIFAMAENQQNHRIGLEKYVITQDSKRADRGLVLAFILGLVVCIGGIGAVLTGKDLTGLALIFVPLASLIGVFINTQKIRREEREERNKNITEKKTTLQGKKTTSSS